MNCLLSKSTHLAIMVKNGMSGLKGIFKDFLVCFPSGRQREIMGVRGKGALE
jgi:hypothetical protein